MKNATSGQSVAAKSLNASQTIAMTGTPVENRLSEYWSILETVQPRLLGSLKDFTETFAAPIETDHSESAAEAFRPDRHPIIREKRRGSIGYFRLFY